MRNVATGWNLVKKSAMFALVLTYADLDVAFRDELADVEVAQVDVVWSDEGQHHHGRASRAWERQTPPLAVAALFFVGWGC